MTNLDELLSGIARSQLGSVIVHERHRLVEVVCSERGLQQVKE